jgi:hypothetical protein
MIEKNLRETLQNIQTCLPKKSNKRMNSLIKPSLQTVIRPYDFLYENEIYIQTKVKQIPFFEKRYHTIQKVSPLQICNHSSFEKTSQNNDEDGNIDDDEDDDLLQTTFSKTSYLLITYSFSPDNYTWERFFSLLREEFTKSIHHQKTYFHHYFHSYFYLADSLLSLEKQNIYPLILNEETIYYCDYKKVPIISLPLSLCLPDNEPKINITDWYKHIEHLSEEFSYKKKDILEGFTTLSNYQLSRLYLKEIDKISYKQNKKSIKLIERVKEFFQNVLNSPTSTRETLEQTRDKIMDLFLGLSGLS